MVSGREPADRVRRTVARNLEERLAAEIAGGVLRPGQRLPSERTLSEAYAVSRASVREAIRTLESRGLVESHQGRGTFVRPQGLERLVQVPAGPVSVDDRGVLHLFEVRAIVEPGVVRLAAQRARAEDVAALRQMVEQQQALLEAGRYTSADDARFHVRLARVSGNPVMTRLVEGVMRMLGEVREPARRASGLPASIAGHWEVLRAIEAADPERAAAAMTAHLNRARDKALLMLRIPLPAAG